MEEDYYQTKESVNDYIRLAKDVHGGALIQKLKKFLPRSTTLLEMGSGPGTDWNTLNQDFDVIGSDLSPEFLRHLKAANPMGTFIPLDAISIQTDKMFDGIYSNKVLHHLKNNELADSIQR